MKRKVCVVTSSRADYGLLRWVMQEIREDPELVLQILVTGMHLSPSFGMTYQELENDGFHIDKRVNCLSDIGTSIGIASSISTGTLGIAQSFYELKPDLIILLGDRFEIFSAAIAAHTSKIPIAHIHGGETTAGVFDDAFRHSITKLSQLHFVAAKEYERRVIQLGENPERVFNVGGLGVENIRRTELIPRVELEKKLGLKFLDKSLLVTFHPPTLDSIPPGQQLDELLRSLSKTKNTTLIFTMPNADTGGLQLTDRISEFVRHHENAYAFQSLGYKQYFSCIAQVDGVIGNSSSGLLEVPSFKKGTINIGTRQEGRLQSQSVLNCQPLEKEITSAIEVLLSEEFKQQVRYATNPYGEGFASKQILQIIKKVELDTLLNKGFHDLQ